MPAKSSEHRVIFQVFDARQILFILAQDVSVLASFVFIEEDSHYVVCAHVPDIEASSPVAFSWLDCECWMSFLLGVMLLLMP